MIPDGHLYFDELLIEHPFIHPRVIKKQFSPLEHPKMYRQEFLKSIVLFIEIMPLVEQGIVNLFPDPCDFNSHLRNQMFGMARARLQETRLDLREEPVLSNLMKEEYERSMLTMPRDVLRDKMLRYSPKLDEEIVEAALFEVDVRRQRDPLAVLQEGSFEGGEDGGQLVPFKMAPNFEITMYLAQATGSCIVTDTKLRWRELMAVARDDTQAVSPLAELRSGMEHVNFVFPHDVQEIGMLAARGTFRDYPNIMRKVFKYLSTYPARGPKPNVETSLNAQFKRIHASTTLAAKRFGGYQSERQVACLWPAGGIQNNAVNRLLLMSSSEHHLASVPMALFFSNIVPKR